MSAENRGSARLLEKSQRTARIGESRGIFLMAVWYRGLGSWSQSCLHADCTAGCCAGGCASRCRARCGAGCATSRRSVYTVSPSSHSLPSGSGLDPAQLAAPLDAQVIIAVIDTLGIGQEYSAIKTLRVGAHSRHCRKKWRREPINPPNWKVPLFFKIESVGISGVAFQMWNDWIWKQFQFYLCLDKFAHFLHVISSG